MEPSNDSPFGPLKVQVRWFLGTCSSGRSLWWRAGFRFAVHGTADFGPESRMGNAAVLAQDPDPVDFRLIGHVVDDAVDISRLVLQHREARAFGDHFGDLDYLVGNLAEDFGV
jgi:hypothetical protein